jgi:hypothetical protein
MTQPETGWSWRRRSAFDTPHRTTRPNDDSSGTWEEPFKRTVGVGRTPSDEALPELLSYVGRVA